MQNKKSTLNNRERSQGKSLFAKHPALAISGLLVIVLIITDLLSGAIFIPFDYNAYRCPDPWFHHGLLPNQDTRAQWGGQIYPFTTNSLGFRDGVVREVNPAQPPQKYLIMGDSFLEGVGMVWEETVAGILEEKLTDSGTAVYNSAVVSYSPVFHYLKLKYLIEHEKFIPNRLLVFIDNSDPLNEITYREFKPWYENRTKKLLHAIKRFLYRRSYIYYSVSTLIRAGSANPITDQWNRKMGGSLLDETEKEATGFINAFPLWSHDRTLYEKWGRQGLTLAVENMTRLMRLCKQHDIDVTMIIYPWPTAILKRDMLNLQVDFWQRFANEHQAGFVNLYPPFINAGHPEDIVRKYFIPGDVHWNSEGNSFVASHILLHIQRR
ncbi:MAG: hypothetical protein JXA03_06430 [Bacteroidales bacterium]|nr:hypothetical protein [Bacteroidales bacterium]